MQLVGARQIACATVNLGLQCGVVRRDELAGTTATLGVIGPRNPAIGTKVARNGRANCGCRYADVAQFIPKKVTHRRNMHSLAHRA